MLYTNDHEFTYYSFRYHKYITVEKGFKSDGATGAIDVCSKAYFVHDKLCNTETFDDGTWCSDWQASQILGDILKEEGFLVRQYTWLISTYIYRTLKRLFT